VIVLLMWFYVAGLTFLLRGEINAEIEPQQDTVVSQRSKPRDKKAT
jgi:hypothetical protein